jgi:hypothetical protein
MAKGIKLITTHSDAARALPIDFGDSLIDCGGDKAPRIYGSYFDAAQAFVMPKMVLGATMVLKSLKMNSQIVYEWYHKYVSAHLTIKTHWPMTDMCGWSNRGGSCIIYLIPLA